MKFSYDKRADVLYIAFDGEPPRAYVVVENESGDILKLDRKNRSVIGCTIPYFRKRLEKGILNIPEVSGVPFNDFAEELFRPK